jgi:hypothetical protein
MTTEDCEWNDKLRRAAEECLSRHGDARLAVMKQEMAARSPGGVSTSDGAFVLLFQTPTSVAEAKPASCRFLSNAAYRSVLADIGACFPLLNKGPQDDVVTAVVFLYDSTLYHATFVYTSSVAENDLSNTPSA